MLSTLAKNDPAAILARVKQLERKAIAHGPRNTVTPALQACRSRAHRTPGDDALARPTPTFAALPPDHPALAPETCELPNRAAELALARLSAVSGLVPSVDWLPYSAIHKEALLTFQIEGTQATLTDLFDQEAGLAVNNRDDIEEITNYMQAFRMVRDNLHDPHGLPLSVRLICDAHCALLTGVRGANRASPSEAGRQLPDSKRGCQAAR
jgi:hypothetical protein